VQISDIPRLSFAEVQFDRNLNYKTARYIYNDSADSISFPAISEQKLNAWQTQRKININFNTGIIVGFVSSLKNYEVHLGGIESSISIDLIYFDRYGNNISQPELGGGFAIFNAPLEHQEVILIENNNKKIYSQLLPVDAGHVHVLSF